MGILDFFVFGARFFGGQREDLVGVSQESLVKSGLPVGRGLGYTVCLVHWHSMRHAQQCGLSDSFSVDAIAPREARVTVGSGGQPLDAGQGGVNYTSNTGTHGAGFSSVLLSPQEELWKKDSGYSRWMMVLVYV